MLITWDQVCPSSAARWPQTPVETVVVTGEAYILDFEARLELEDGDVDLAELLAADGTDRHLDAASIRPRTSRTWPTPAGRPA